MKTFLSIGSGPGIGTATAERFAREGFRVILTSRNTANLAERAKELTKMGYEVEIYRVDAGELFSVATLVREVEARFGTIDVLHFNSASMRPATLEQQSPETFVPDLTVTIAGALVAVQEVSRAMLARGSGTILLTGGGFALAPSPDYLTLSIGKAGIRALALALFPRFRERGVHIATVTVSALVAPGSVEAGEVADTFWDLHAASPECWDAEMTYPRSS